MRSGNFSVALIASKRQDDLTSALLQAESEGLKLSEDELVGMAALLLTTSHETTVNLIDTSR